MYTALLTFAKSAMLSQNISILDLALYRCSVLVIIEAAKQLLFPPE